MKNFKEIIPIGGLLFITTIYTPKENDVFSLAFENNKQHCIQIVSEQEFLNRFNDKNVLPERQFSYNTIKSLIKKNGFKIEEMHAYHYKILDKTIVQTIEYDEKMNKQKNYNEAKDVLYILRRI